MSSIESLLITGSNGSIGQSFLTYLENMPEKELPKKIVLVNRNQPVQLSPELKRKSEIIFFLTDLTKQWDFNLKVSHVLNLAGDGSSTAYSKDSAQNFVKICNNLSDWALINKPKVIVHASSGACFYNTSKNKEYMNKVNLIDSRLHSESIINQIKENLEVNVILARLFTFIGPNLLTKQQYAAPLFISEAVSKNLIKVTGNPNTVRSYMHELTMSDWLFSCLQTNKMEGIVSVGSSIPVTIRDLVEFISSKTNSKIIFETPNSEISIYLPTVKNEISYLGVSEGPKWQDSIEKCINIYSRRGEYFGK